MKRLNHYMTMHRLFIWQVVDKITCYCFNCLFFLIPAITNTTNKNV